MKRTPIKTRPVGAGSRSLEQASPPPPGSLIGFAPNLASTGNTKTSSSRRLHRRDAAAYLGLSLSWLDKSRMTGTGPVYIEIGGRVVYDLDDLDAFLAANRRVSVSAQQA